MTEGEREEVVAKLKAWMATPEGKEQMRKMSEGVRQLIAKLKEEEKVSPELLRQPMTI
jgi:hypothetical protein